MTGGRVVGRTQRGCECTGFGIIEKDRMDMDGIVTKEVFSTSALADCALSFIRANMDDSISISVLIVL